MYNVLRGIASALTIGAIVLLFGGLQNGLVWDHLAPANFNETLLVAFAGVAASYGFYLGVTG